MANSKLTKETLIPVGLMMAVVVSVSSGAVWLNTQLQGTNYKLSALELKLDSIQEQLKAASLDRWSSRDMKLWIELLKAKNPKMEIPQIEK
jgi:hypothetical protein